MLHPANKEHQRRRYQRYRLNSHAFQVLSHQYSFTGWGKDISKKGLSFKYTPYFVEIGGLTEMEIFLYDGYQYYLPVITCRIVYDINAKPMNKGYSFREYRRCGLEFKTLTDEQAINVRGLIRTLKMKSSRKDSSWTDTGKIASHLIQSSPSAIM